MKKFYVLFVVLLGVSFLSASTPKNNTRETIDWVKAEENYKADLKSDNNGVVTSAANYVRKYNLTGAVDELTSLLTQDNTETVKMSAALALVSVGGEKGRTAVENASETEESEVLVAFYRSILSATLTAQQ